MRVTRPTGCCCGSDGNAGGGVGGMAAGNAGGVVGNAGDGAGHGGGGRSGCTGDVGARVCEIQGTRGG